MYKDQPADVLFIEPDQMEYYWNEFSKRYITYVNMNRKN